MHRTTLALLLTNLVLSLAALGWLAWITVEPHHWFADAYAGKGPSAMRGHVALSACKDRLGLWGRIRKRRFRVWTTVWRLARA